MNEDMAGKYLGGGMLKFAVKDGEIYLHSQQIAQILYNVASSLYNSGIEAGSKESLVGAQLIAYMSNEFTMLRSELLKREAEKLFNLPE